MTPCTTPPPVRRPRKPRRSINQLAQAADYFWTAGFWGAALATYNELVPLLLSTDAPPEILAAAVERQAMSAVHHRNARAADRVHRVRS